MIWPIVFGLALIGFGAFIVYDVRTEGMKDMKTGKAKMIVKILGEKGAAVFYSSIGAIIILCGIGVIISKLLGR